MPLLLRLNMGRNLNHNYFDIDSLEHHMMGSSNFVRTRYLFYVYNHIGVIPNNIVYNLVHSIKCIIWLRYICGDRVQRGHQL